MNYSFKHFEDGYGSSCIHEMFFLEIWSWILTEEYRLYRNTEKWRMIKCPWRSAIIECRTRMYRSLKFQPVGSSGCSLVRNDHGILAIGERDCKLNERKRSRDHFREHSRTVDPCWVAQKPTNVRQVPRLFLVYSSSSQAYLKMSFDVQVESFRDATLSHCSMIPNPDSFLGKILLKVFLWIKNHGRISNPFNKALLPLPLRCGFSHHFLSPSCNHDKKGDALRWCRWKGRWGGWFRRMLTDS